MSPVRDVDNVHFATAHSQGGGQMAMSDLAWLPDTRLAETFPNADEPRRCDCGPVEFPSSAPIVDNRLPPVSRCPSIRRSRFTRPQILTRDALFLAWPPGPRARSGGAVQ